MKSAVVDSLLSLVMVVVVGTPAYGAPRDEWWQSRAVANGEVIRGTFSGLVLDDTALSQRQFHSVYLEACNIDTADLVRDSSFRVVTLRDCTIGSLGLQGQGDGEDVLYDLRLIDSRVGSLVIDGMCVQRLVLQDCEIDSLTLRRCRLNGLQVLGGKLGELRIIDCTSERVSITGQTNVNQVVIEGGRTDWLDCGRMDLVATRLTLDNVVVQHMYLRREQVAEFDLSGIVFPSNDFRLWQEAWAFEAALGKRVNEKLYNEAALVYAALGERLAAVGRGGDARQIEYRSQVCRRITDEIGSRRIISYLWGEYFRGRYGTSWQTVLLTAGVVWAVFTLLFIILGLARFGWALEVPVSPLGAYLAGGRSRMILPYGERSFGNYTIMAGIFSIEHLLVIGSRVFQVTGVSDLIKPVPKYLMPVGVGRYLALIESLLGLALIVNFVRAFVGILLT